MANRIFILILTTFAGLWSFAAPLNCQRPLSLVSAQGRLTRLWHLEYTGADIAKKFVSGQSTSPVGAAILDSSLPRIGQCPRFVTGTSNLKILPQMSTIEKMHGELVGTVMAGPDGATDLPDGYHRVIEDEFRNGRNQYNDLIRAFQSKSGLKVVNYSMGPTDNSFGAEFKRRIDEFRKLDEKGVILVTAAGNNANRNAKVDTYTENFPGIIVGGMTFRGKHWSHSQSSDQIFILAPADQIPTKGNSGQAVLESGTSLATPLVSGSIINTLKILPHMSRQNVEELIKATGISLPVSSGAQQPQPSAKMLNSYKMVRVAARIRYLLEKERIQNPKEIQSYISGILSKPGLFIFKEETDGLMTEAKKFENSNDCEKLWQSVEFYQKAYLLSENPSARAELAKLYDRLGYNLNATFYK